MTNAIWCQPKRCKKAARASCRILKRGPWPSLIASLIALCASPARADEPAARALTVDGSVLSDIMSVVKGGEARGTRVLSRADLRINYDGTRGKLPWLSGQIDVAATNGTSISALVGDTQGISNIEYDRTLRLVNAWVQISLPHAALKAGIIDSNLDFNEQNVGVVFLHASHGIGPELSGAGLDGGGASPNTTLGVIASVFDANTGWKLRAGAFNGRPGDALRPGEPNFTLNQDHGALLIAEADWTRNWGRVAVGGWHFTSRMPRLDGEGEVHHANGGFAIVEPVLINHRDGLQLRGWLRVGMGDELTDMVRTYVGGGLVASGLWRKLPQDTLGVAVAHAQINPRAGDNPTHETAFELTFQHRVRGWLTLQPDVQWVVHPGGFGATPNALVLGLRVIVTKGLR
jgi:porin